MIKYKSIVKNFKVILGIISVILFFGCEDVITYELDSSDPQMVIDAAVTDTPNSGVVQLSMSTDYFNPGNFEKVSNAVVEINDSEGNVYNLIEETLGVYKNSNLNIEYNKQYDLKVIANEKTYSASTTLAKPLIIDSLSYSFESFFGEKYCDVFIHFQDPQENEDFAIIYIKRNNEDYEFPLLYDDRLTNGNYFKESLIQIPKEELLEGSNTVEFLLHTVDEETYEYYKTLLTVLASNNDGSLFSPSSPENPKSNINNNVLGYFGGYSVSRRTIEIINN